MAGRKRPLPPTVDLATALAKIPQGFWDLPEIDQERICGEIAPLLALPRTPTPRQLAVIVETVDRSLKDPILFGGAVGGGKSSLLCMLAIHLARAVPKNRILMVRKEYSAFADSTLKELEEQLLDCPDFKFWPGKHEAHCTNGSQIWWTGVGTAKQMQKLGSTQFGAVLVDEAPELERSIFTVLQMRTRLPLASAARRTCIVLTANPYPGWVRDDFITQPKAGYIFIRSKLTDNPHNYAGYLEDLRAVLPDDFFEAFVEGDWYAFAPDDQSIPEMLIDRARKREEMPVEDDVVWGVDVARKGKDWTEVYGRSGAVFRRIDGWQHARLTESGDIILDLYRLAEPKPSRINIDDAGVGGGLVDILVRAAEEKLLGDCEIGEVVGASTKQQRDPVHYGNVTAELVYGMRELLASGHGDLDPDDYQLAGDLAAFQGLFRGPRRVVTPNEVIRGVLGRSPDRGNACLLTLYGGTGNIEHRRDYVPHQTKEDELEEMLARLPAGERARVAAEMAEIERRQRAVEAFARRVGAGLMPWESSPEDADLERLYGVRY